MESSQAHGSREALFQASRGKKVGVGGFGVFMDAHAQARNPIAMISMKMREKDGTDVLWSSPTSGPQQLAYCALSTVKQKSSSMVR